MKYTYYVDSTIIDEYYSLWRHCDEPNEQGFTWEISYPYTGSNVWLPAFATRKVKNRLKKLSEEDLFLLGI